MVHGARNKPDAPMFGLSAFREQMYCIEESTCDIDGIFRRPPMIWRPGHCDPFPLRYAHALAQLIS